MRKLAIIFILFTASAAAFSQDMPAGATTPTNAEAAFEKLKTLSGSWHGVIMNVPIDVTIRSASSGTAIVYEGNTLKGPPQQEVTMFYVEDGRLMATHYCDAGNRARFEGKLSSDSKTMDFTFLDVSGPTKGGLVKRMVFTAVDANTHNIMFTFIMPNGKAIDLKGEFKRTNTREQSGTRSQVLP
jgi:hypothetical protein